MRVLTRNFILLVKGTDNLVLLLDTASHKLDTISSNIIQNLYIPTHICWHCCYLYTSSLLHLPVNQSHWKKNWSEYFRNC